METLTPILDAYQALLGEIDGWFAGCLERAAPGRIQCRQGCTGCCRGLFDITLLDAWLLRQAFGRLPEALRLSVRGKAEARLLELRRAWPGLTAPFLLNAMPDAEWTEMPEDDPTPCPLLGDDGLCLVYAARPMTCRLHGLPNIDLSGESFSDACCTLNCLGVDPLADPVLRWPFRQAFLREQQLFRDFSRQLTGRVWNELDTFIPTALLIDPAAVDWRRLVLIDPRGQG